MADGWVFVLTEPAVQVEFCCTLDSITDRDPKETGCKTALCLELEGRPLVCGWEEKELTLNPKLCIGAMGATLAGMLTSPERALLDVTAKPTPEPRMPDAKVRTGATAPRVWELGTLVNGCVKVVATTALAGNWCEAVGREVGVACWCTEVAGTDVETEGSAWGGFTISFKSSGG